MRVADKLTWAMKTHEIPVFVGPGTVLANPWGETNLDIYYSWLMGRLQMVGSVEWNEMMKLLGTDNLVLVCFCGAERCHKDVIYEILEGVKAK